MPKYDPLFDHLIRLNSNEWHTTFGELERVLGFYLPASARAYPAWWANQEPPSSQSVAWSEAGWVTEELNLTAEMLIFRRVSGSRSRARKHSVRNQQNEQPNFEIASTEPAQQILLTFAWQQIGKVELDGRGLLRFPMIPSLPGLYRFGFELDTMEHWYIGETTNLQRRLQWYRTPGSTQQTNVRLNQELREAMNSGAVVDLAVIVGGVNITVAGEIDLAVDLSNKLYRRFIENAALISYGKDSTKILNR